MTHETSRICFVGPDFVINKNMPLHQDSNDLTISEGILEPVSKDKDQRQTLPGLVWP